MKAVHALNGFKSKKMVTACFNFLLIASGGANGKGIL
jgi:hypothetical protein